AHVVARAWRAGGEQGAERHGQSAFDRADARRRACGNACDRSLRREECSAPRGIHPCSWRQRACCAAGRLAARPERSGGGEALDTVSNEEGWKSVASAHTHRRASDALLVPPGEVIGI